MRSSDDREFGNAALNTVSLQLILTFSYAFSSELSSSFFFQATKYPASAFMFIRDLLGKNMSNPVVKTFQKRFPYYKMEDDEERSTINFEHPE